MSHELEPNYVDKDTKEMEVEVAFYVKIKGQYFTEEELEENIADIKHSLTCANNVIKVEVEKI